MPDLHDIPGEILVRGCLLKSNLTPFVGSDIARKILKGLKSIGISELNPLQKRIISGVLCEYDVFAVAPKYSGKQAGVLLPLLTHAIASRTGTSEMYRASAPSVIIVCSSTPTAMSMMSTIRQIFESGLTEIEELPMTIILDSLTDAKVLTFFHMEADILITTGRFLTYLMESPDSRIKKELKLKFHRLKYLLFEELAMTDRHMSEDVIKFLRYLGLLVNTKMTCPPTSKNLQVLFYGTEWNDSIKGVQEALSGNCRKSVMIFGSTFHALQFAQLPWTVDHCPDKFSKFAQLQKLCERAIREGKSLVIACSTCELAKKTSKDLASLGNVSHTLYTLESSGRGGRKDLVGVFKPVYEDMNWVSVVCDDALHLLENEVDVSCLVNYDTDVPSDKVYSWPFNPKRYACLWKKLHSAKYKEDFGARSHLFISGKEENLLSVIRFLNSLSLPLTPTLHNTVKRLEAEHQLKLPICPAVKWLGQCEQIQDGLCTYRHKIVQGDLDPLPDSPTNGELEFRVVSCQIPSMYIGRMMKHFVFQNGKRVCVKSFSDEFKAQITRLAQYYKIGTNRVAPTNIAIGELFCIPFSSVKGNSSKSYKHRYLRVKILDLDPASKGNVGENIPLKSYKVFCIDAGIDTTVPEKNLLVMPQEFKEWRVHSVEIVLSNLHPPDLTGEYTSSGIRAARELTVDRIWNAKILIAIGNTVWVNPMVTLEEDPITGHCDRMCNARTAFVRRGHAKLQQDVNVMHGLLLQIREVQPNYPAFPHEEILFVPVKRMQKLANCKAKPTFQKTAAATAARFKEFHKPGSEVSWASIHLSKVDPNDLQIQPVTITLGPLHNPGEVYATKLFDGDDEEKTNQIPPVIMLELGLSREVEQMLLDKTKVDRNDYLDFFVYGGVVAVNPPGEAQRWVRGLITEIKTTEECSKFTVFLVDYGDHLDYLCAVNLMPLFGKYVKQLPFQAFSFNLSHICPLNHGGWDSASTAAFSKIMDTFDHFPKTVKLVAFESEKTILGYYHYKALAIVPDFQGLVVYNGEEIGLQFVKMGFAKTTPDWMDLVSLVKIGVQIPIQDKWGETETLTFGPPDDDDSESDPINDDDSESDPIDDWDTLGVLEELSEPNEEDELCEPEEPVEEEKLPEPEDEVKLQQTNEEEEDSNEEELEENLLFDVVTEMKEKVMKNFLESQGSESVDKDDVVKASVEVAYPSGSEAVGNTELGSAGTDCIYDDDGCEFYDSFENVSD